MRHQLTAFVVIACGVLLGHGAVAVRQAAAPQANLLSFSSGTIVRSYTPGLTDVHMIADSGGASMAEETKGPIQVVYELPAVATLTGLAIALDDESKGTVAVSTTSAKDGFRDIGAATGTPRGEPSKLAGAAGIKARWVRVIATVASTAVPVSGIVATGTLPPRPADAAAVTGDFWAYGAGINGGGGVLPKPADETPERLEVTQIADGMNGLQCSSAGFVAAFPGKLTGRTWTYTTEYAGNVVRGELVMNDEGTLLVGADAGGAMRAFARTAGGALPEYCTVTKHGAGTTGVLVLNSPHWDDSYPGSNLGELPDLNKTLAVGFAGAALLTPALLNSVQLAVLNGVCRPQFMFNAPQSAALMQWVQAGHTLLITDSDMCGEPTSYDFLPYKFKSDNPGAKGAEGHTLVVVENDTLGTTDKGDKAHFLDAAAYAKDPNNQLGDANTVVTQDDHWCGHLFGVNAKSVSGFMQMYAIHGKGLIIYDGLDVDDSPISHYRTIRRLEYAQPVPADLPCTRRADAGFLLVSDDTRAFVPGKAQTITVPLQVLSNRGWKGHVTLAAAGDFHAAVSPAAVDLPPDERPLSVAIDVPATAKAGHYAVIVKGSGGGNQSSQATITLNSAETTDALRAALASDCTVPVYGVNFDFNNTTLRADADPVLQQILALFRNDPVLAAEIGGHTDNVGTAPYNLTLSAGRAEAVKTWLVTHGIAAPRLTTHGYGDTAPLVPNDSDANRARNRRVELKKPNCGK